MILMPLTYRVYVREIDHYPIVTHLCLLLESILKPFLLPCIALIQIVSYTLALGYHLVSPTKSIKRSILHLGYAIGVILLYYLALACALHYGDLQSILRGLGIIIGSSIITHLFLVYK